MTTTKFLPSQRQAVAALSINALPDSVRGEIMRDKSFCNALDLTPKYLFSLSDDLSVDVDSLHASLREAAKGSKKSILTEKDGRATEAVLNLTEDGRATLVAKGQGFVFANVHVFSKRRIDRVRALKKAFAERPLAPSEEEDWLALAHQRGLANDEYTELSSAFGMTVRGLTDDVRVASGLTVDMLMPDDPAYYSRLIAPPSDAPTLPAYIAQTLDPQRQREIRRHRRSAFRRFAFSALWRPLIPFHLLASVRVDELRALLDANDPYTLLFGFELCCAHFKKHGIRELGSLFLDRLFGDRDASFDRCKIFAAFAFLSLSRIRRAARAEQAPVYWSRLAALAHAGVLTDAVFGKIEAAPFFDWMRQRFGPDCIWHVNIERWDSPRWAPQWILPDHLFAELLGRAVGAASRIPEKARPPEWVALLSALPDRLADQGRLQPTFLPGPFDDHLEGDRVRLDRFDEMEAAIEQAQTLDDARDLHLLAHAATPTPRLIAAAIRLVDTPDQDPPADGNGRLLSIFAAGHLAAAGRSIELCDALRNRCMRELRGPRAPGRSVEFLAVMSIACGAHSEIAKYRSALAEAAATISSMADSSDFSGLLAIFRTLAIADPKLASHLARAQSIVHFREPAQLIAGLD